MPDGGLGLSEDEKWSLLVEEVMLRASEARKDPAKLIEFTMRNIEGRRIRVPPHHRVALKFLWDHRRALAIWPINTGKSFCSVALVTKMLGDDPTARGAILSASQAQAEKTLRAVSDHVTGSPELRLVYPKLRPSQRAADKWTQSTIIVDRPAGIPDPSLVAIGADTKRIQGSRLSFVIVDDLLSLENSSTPEARAKLLEFFYMFIRSRLDLTRSRIVICNTVYHPEDLVHELERKGWATLRMDIEGSIKVQDDRQRKMEARMLGVPFVPWDHEELVDAGLVDEVYRLRSHGPDPKRRIPLWPERFLYEWSEHLGRYPKNMDEALLAYEVYIAGMRDEMPPIHFNRLLMGVARDEGTAFCKSEWVEKCKKLGRDLGHHHFLPEYKGEDPTFTGVDLAFSQEDRADYTALFTYQQQADGKRRVLDIDVGRWDAPTVRAKIIDKEKRFNSVVRLEGNSAQRLMKDMVNDLDNSVPIRSVDTTRHNKHHLHHGVHSVFNDFYTGTWIIPNGPGGELHPFTKKWLDDCLYFEPDKHTGDVLMASWLAREQAREWGALGKRDPRLAGGNIAGNIMAR